MDLNSIVIAKSCSCHCGSGSSSGGSSGGGISNFNIDQSYVNADGNTVIVFGWKDENNTDKTSEVIIQNNIIYITEQNKANFGTYAAIKLQKPQTTTILYDDYILNSLNKDENDVVTAIFTKLVPALEEDGNGDLKLLWRKATNASGEYVWTSGDRTYYSTKQVTENISVDDEGMLSILAMG